jgi:hypothetical protein
MNPNPLDGDRAADAYDEAEGVKQTNRILDAFHKGQIDSLVGKKYFNPFNKKKQWYKFIAYRNGYYGKRK